METDAIASPQNTDITDLANIQRKMHFAGTVIRATLAGAVVDIGMETPGVVHISQLQSEPVNRVEDVVQPGQIVDVWVRRVIPKKNRIELTMIKPLDLEWREISKDMVVKGRVTRLEKFGAFVDIGAERPGLVHISEMTRDYIKNSSDVVTEGDEIEVKVLDVNRHKKQIRLSMKALEEPPKKKFEKTSKSSEPTEVEEIVPTAMEIALREAMERSKDQLPENDKSKANQKSKKTSADLEQILSRTLEHKVRTK